MFVRKIAAPVFRFTDSFGARGRLNGLLIGVEDVAVVDVDMGAIAVAAVAVACSLLSGEQPTVGMFCSVAVAFVFNVVSI